MFFIFLSACSKDDCINNVLGKYSGSCFANPGTFQGDMTISQSPDGGSKLLILDNMLDNAGSTYNASFSSDCKTIDVPFQMISLSFGGSGTISGTYQLNGTSLTGNLNINVGGMVTICSYNLTKG